MAGRWTCHICGHELKNAQGLFMHKCLAHQMTPDEARQNPSQQVFRCPHCRFFTLYAGNLSRHIQNSH